ncbi:MAG: hypothetical protein IJT36_03195 [Alphaproteobacteria bacterium]|nr:hypothetical protein [Clostridia bacterium]MBQ6530064.1 hypothetical protein [Clostridia bacterium]MBQ7673514.1 hypothetical protein [Alphaproteobacteria bacterium]
MMLFIEDRVYRSYLTAYNRALRQLNNNNLYNLFKAYLDIVQKLYRIVRVSDINGSIERIGNETSDKVGHTFNVQFIKVTRLLTDTVSELSVVDSKDWVYLVLGIQNIMNDTVANIAECYNNLILELCGDNHNIQKIVPLCITIKDNYNTTYIPDSLTRIIKNMAEWG